VGEALQAKTLTATGVAEVFCIPRYLKASFRHRGIQKTPTDDRHLGFLLAERGGFKHKTINPSFVGLWFFITPGNWKTRFPCRG